MSAGQEWTLTTCRSPDGTALGARLADGTLVEVEPLRGYPGLLAVLRAGIDLERSLDGWSPDVARPIPGAVATAPLRFPGKILCAGANYREHLREMTSTDIPAGVKPWFFAIPATNTVIGSGDAIRIPHDPAAKVDWEGELAVVIGKPLRAATRTAAMQAVAGYLVVNDITARGLSRPAPPLAPPMSVDWVSSKAQDTFCPMGPGMRPAWLIDRPDSLRIRTWVNDELVQDGSTADMIFDVADLLVALSAMITLDPGDVIATGTPSGTGVSIGRFLADGDTVAVEIEGIGRLTNPVSARADADPRESSPDE